MGRKCPIGSAKKATKRAECLLQQQNQALHASGTDGSLGLAGQLLCEGGDVPAGQLVPDNTRGASSTVPLVTTLHTRAIRH